VETNPLKKQLSSSNRQAGCLDPVRERTLAVIKLFQSFDFPRGVVVQHTKYEHTVRAHCFFNSIYIRIKGYE
jgi:hypothetical protein